MIAPALFGQYVAVKFDMDFGSVDRAFQSNEDGAVGTEHQIKNGTASPQDGAKFDSTSALWSPSGQNCTM